MKFSDLLKIYESYQLRYGSKAFQYISQMLQEAKKIHKTYFEQSPTAQRAILEGRQPDHEQSWRAFKGKNLEKLIKHITFREVENLGLQIIEGSKLEKKTQQSDILGKVKRNLLVDFGEFGCHLPDIDLVIYEQVSSKIIAVLSIKVTLRERIAQTGYWTIKLKSDKITEHIKVFFVTLDEDNTLSAKFPTKKGRAIAEVDTDGSYVLSETPLQESEKIKTFDKFIDDLEKLLNATY